jgi:hypothetical protein
MTVSGTIDPNKIFEVQLPSAPYPGLRPFQKSEWPIFFGREMMTDRIISLLLSRRLLVVHGSSGNGKSSLIRAGVLARLEQEHVRSGIRWRTCSSVPGEEPLTNFAKSLAKEAAAKDLDWLTFRRALNHGTQAASELARILELNSENRLCILVDQFEELFSVPRDREGGQATLFCEFLVGFSEAPPEGLFILVTMRSEFLGLCAQFSGLAQAINRSQYLLPKMDTENLLRAVREPARLYGGGISEQFAEELMMDARENEDELPLIQHGLSQLWAASVNRETVLDSTSFPVKVSLSSLLSDHAGRVLQQAAHSDSQAFRVVEELFRALTTINSEGHAIRRPRRFSELVEVTGSTEKQLRSIIEAFRRPGVSFITPLPPEEILSDTLIDISHEALVRHWKKISDPDSGWLRREFDDGLVWQSLRVQFGSFRSNPANVLSAATTEERSLWLKSRNEAWARRYGDMWPQVSSLLDASRLEIQRQHEIERDRKTIESRAKRNRYLMIAALIAAVIFGSVAIVVWDAEKEAVRQTDLAKSAEQQAQKDRQAALVASRQATEARAKAEEDRIKAVNSAIEADSARKDALDSLKRANEEILRANEAADRAKKVQAGSADSFVNSRGSTRDTLRQALAALANQNDPIQVAILGQVVGQLARFADPSQIQVAIETLIKNFSRSRDSASASAIAEALTNIAANLDQQQAEAEAKILLSVPAYDLMPLDAVALTLGALAPKLDPALSGEAITYLFNALMSVSDPKVAGDIVTGLTNLNWTPTAIQSKRVSSHVLELLAAANDPASVESLAAALEAMAPTLERSDAQKALSTIRSLGKQYGDLLSSAQIAVTNRLEGLSKPATEKADGLNLFQKMSGNKWCVGSKSYNLQVSGGSIIWRDNVGSYDLEQIVSVAAADAQTRTLKSVHADGKSEPLGTTWTYRLGTGNKISVKSTSGKDFTLVGC